MQIVPQIVRDRLKAMPPAVDHPDADALTAFAEKSLPDSERAVVLAHLARCGDCRDIVALALPEADASQAVTVPARSGWLTWPTLRWGFAAVGIALIASFGVLQYQRSRPAMNVATDSRNENVTAKVQSPLPSAANTPTRQSENALDATQPSGGTLASGARARTPEALISRAAPQASPGPQGPSSVGGVIGGQVAYGPHMPTQQQQQTTINQMQAAMPAAPVAKQQSAGASANLRMPAASETVNVEGAATQIETTQAEVGRAQNQPAPLPSETAEQLFDKDAVGKAKPAVVLSGRNFTVLVVPRWAINSAGGLQRSFDQGQTWQDVDVSAGALPSAGAKSLVAAKAAPAKEYSANKKALKAPTSGPGFRAVAATGTDVWAGGSYGVLYHSVDSGNHWKQVVPSSAGVTLTGDIVGLVFSDAQHGTVTTSTGEFWSTSDQGQTWQKQ